MRIAGFSTGAIAKGDFRAALEVLHRFRIKAVELSALREHELPGLIQALPTLDLGMFDYVSVHAPSTLEQMTDRDVVGLLSVAARHGFPIVLHPDVILDHGPWRSFGSLLLIENMDKRKTSGRNVSELEDVFDELPQAQLCFDAAHARQVDPTMSEAVAMLTQFRTKLRQIHLSELDSDSRHTRLTGAAIYAFQQVAPIIDPAVPIILESPVPSAQIPLEVSMARESLDLAISPSSGAV